MEGKVSVEGGVRRAILDVDEGHKGLSPEVPAESATNEERVNAITNADAGHEALRLRVVLGHVGDQELVLNACLGGEHLEHLGDVLSTVVDAKCLDLAVQHILDRCLVVLEGVEQVRLVAKEVGVNLAQVVVEQDDGVELAAEGRCLETDKIGVVKVEWALCVEEGKRMRKYSHFCRDATLQSFPSFLSVLAAVIVIPCTESDITSCLHNHLERWVIQ